MKKWWIGASIFGVINLAIVVLIIIYWIPFFSRPPETFHVENLYFVFFMAHGTALWFILQAGWLAWWGFKYFWACSKALLASIVLGVGGLLSLWSLRNLMQFYYEIGQQSSWLRFFNLQEQVEIIAIWLSILIVPLMIFGLFLMVAGKKVGNIQNLSPINLKKYWNWGIICSIVFILAWGMLLSFRDASLLSYDDILVGNVREFSWIAIYNPLSAIVALFKSIFQGPMIAAEASSNLHTIFAHPQFGIPRWPPFFPILFWGKMILMLLLLDLSIGFSWLVRKEK